MDKNLRKSNTKPDKFFNYNQQQELEEEQLEPFVAVIIPSDTILSSFFSNLKIEISNLNLMEHKSSLLKCNKDLVGIEESNRNSLVFFGPDENTKSDIITTLFPILFLEPQSIVSKCLLPPPLISYEHFSIMLPQFESEFRYKDLTIAKKVCGIDGEKYYRLMVITSKDDIHNSYSALFQLFLFEHVKLDKC
jgi:hypothetical protein